jgi:hypothetical protein
MVLAIKRWNMAAVHAPIEERVCDDRQTPPTVRSVQGVIRNCLQKPWIAPVAHWQTSIRLLALSFLGAAWLFLLLQLILPISRALVTFLAFAFGHTCVQRRRLSAEEATF